MRTWLGENYPSDARTHSHYLLSSLNPIAWFLNLRGGDIAFDPVFYAYVLVSLDAITVWIQSESLDDKVIKAIKEFGGEIRDYAKAMDEIPNAVGEHDVLVTDGTVSWAVVDRVGQVRYWLSDHFILSR